MKNQKVAIKSDIASRGGNYLLEKSYIITMYLTNDCVVISDVEEALRAFKRVSEEYTVEEIEAFGRLYDKDSPITIAELVRFEHRIVPTTLLVNLDEDLDELEVLSDIELANLILEKFSIESFRNRAKRKFIIKC